ncbi:hypothetical protein N656DRAFT_28538 [Canariomyces notabilis]|uniref:Uncharacterized protein n=1 Tax=Canariomyces notabilis TaxID=2074819 RepID=A0AAN6TMS5_9PEZI|nr:hypothetical protein N656DRAFT_28538 [Canariomyces arenarius]
MGCASLTVSGPWQSWLSWSDDNFWPQPPYLYSEEKCQPRRGFAACTREPVKPVLERADSGIESCVPANAYSGSLNHIVDKTRYIRASKVMSLPHPRNDTKWEPQKKIPAAQNRAGLMPITRLIDLQYDATESQTPTSASSMPRASPTRGNQRGRSA